MKQPRESSAQRLDGTKPKQLYERGNRTKVPAKVYALDNQQAPESSEATEGKNFEDEISLRGRECDDWKNFHIFFLKSPFIGNLLP